MELKSTEIEVWSLAHLYQKLYNATLVSKDQNDLISWPLISTNTQTILTQHANLKDHLPSWDDMLLRTIDMTKFPPDHIKTEEGISNCSANASSPESASGVVAQSKTKLTVAVPASVNIEAMTNEPLTIEPESILESFQSFQSRLLALQTKMNRFTKKLHETDPITKAPRYGAKTQVRAKSLILMHATLLSSLKAIFQTPSTIIIILPINNDDDINPTLSQLLECAVRDQTTYCSQKKEQEIHELLSKENTSKRKMEEQIRLEKLKQTNDAKRQEEEMKLISQKAEEIRLAKKKEEEIKTQKTRARRLANQLLMRSIAKGEGGVSTQLDKLKKLKQNENNGREYNEALKSLYKIFQQITAHPDNELLRIINKNNEKFYETVGRHEGGYELFLAAGFKLVCPTDDETQEYMYLKEPNIETDMDGWSQWFDGLKTVLKLIEDEMIARKLKLPH